MMLMKTTTTAATTNLWKNSQGQRHDQSLLKHHLDLAVCHPKLNVFFRRNCLCVRIWNQCMTHQCVRAFASKQEVPFVLKPIQIFFHDLEHFCFHHNRCGVMSQTLVACAHPNRCLEQITAGALDVERMKALWAKAISRIADHVAGIWAPYLDSIAILRMNGRKAFCNFIDRLLCCKNVGRCSLCR